MAELAAANVARRAARRRAADAVAYVYIFRLHIEPGGHEMTQDSIEREVTIEAPVERVWSVITEAEHVGRWFGDAGAEVDLRPGGRDDGALGERRHRACARRGRRAAAALRLPLVPLQPHRRRRASTRRRTPPSSSSRSRPRATARGCASSSRGFAGLARRRARSAPRTTRATCAAGRRSSASSSRTRRRWPPDRTARTGGPRRARRPDALAGPLPPRRARRGDGDDAGRRAAGQPRRRDQAPGGARPRGPGHLPPRRPRGPATRSARSASARRPPTWRRSRAAGTGASRRSRRWRKPAG